MKHPAVRSKTSLFLMEMIISLLILSLTSCICVQIFGEARSLRERARQWNHVQELLVTAGEFLEGSSGTSEEYLALFPEGIEKDGHLYYYYDRFFESSSQENARYTMDLLFSRGKRQKSVIVSFYKKEELFFSQEITFPLFGNGKEALHP